MTENENKFFSYANGTCKIIINSKVLEENLNIPTLSPEGEKIIEIDSGDNPFFTSIDGVLFDKAITTLIACPVYRERKLTVPSSVQKIRDGAFGYEDCKLSEIVFQEGLEAIKGSCVLYGPAVVTLPASVQFIDEEAFEGLDYMLSAFATIKAPQNSFAHKFAVKHKYKFMPSDCNETWNAEEWIEKFNDVNVDYRGVRRKVWENTKKIVEDNGYKLDNGDSVLIRDYLDCDRKSCFYDKPFTAAFEPLKFLPEITVVPDDCLDTAHKWVNKGLEVCVLNMANRRNPGGGVVYGAGAQEEYLFRCSDYYKFLYRYAPYAGQYGLMPSHNQYPLDKNYGGIFSQKVKVFRENEKSGYKLAASTWDVNMIAVAGMNHPRLIQEGNTERIAPEFVEGIKSKIRTIFRIACDNNQRNLVLGALGCGAFHNPPEHVAELFREVLCEYEFQGAFNKICFAVKSDHNSKGYSNYLAFKKVLHRFVPKTKYKINSSDADMLVKKIAINSDKYAVLKENGEVMITDIFTQESKRALNLNNCVDIAGGFDHFIGLNKFGNVVFEATGPQAPTFVDLFCHDGIAIATCEGHSAVLKKDGSILCEHYGMEVPLYSKKIESIHNVKQVALTFGKPYFLCENGKFLCESNRVNDFFNSYGKEIVQIAAFGCYYSEMTVSVLYSDGTVKAFCGFLCDFDEIEEVKSWQDVKKICCGNHAAVTGLTNNGKVLLPQKYPYKDREGKPVTEIYDVIDIFANFDHFIALTRYGKIIYLHNE